MQRINLLEEAENLIKENGYYFDRNTKMIQNSEGYIPIADFATIAHNINYIPLEDGTPQIDPTIKIIGTTNWWLERYITEDTERWIFLKKPVQANIESQNKNLLTKRSRDFSWKERINRK